MDTGALADKLLSLHALESLALELRQKIAQLFADSGKVLTLHPGDVLIHEGDVGGGAGFVLLSGSMHVSHDGNSPINLDAPALLGEMHQFNPRAQRTATVAAATPCEVLKFQWFDFHYRATAALSHEEQDALMTAMERLVWERFQHESICNAPAFAGLDERTRLRTCLTLVWLARDVHLAVGETLFHEGALEGSSAYVLLDGVLGFQQAGHPHGAVTAPALVTASTVFDPQRKWRATAIAKTDCNLLHYEWPELEAYLAQRMGDAAAREVLEEIERANEAFADWL